MAGSNLSQTRGVTSSSQGAVGSGPAAVSGVLSVSLIASCRLTWSAQHPAKAADHITSCVPLLVKQTLSQKEGGPTSRRSTAWLLKVKRRPLRPAWYFVLSAAHRFCYVDLCRYAFGRARLSTQALALLRMRCRGAVVMSRNVPVGAVRQSGVPF